MDIGDPTQFLSAGFSKSLSNSLDFHVPQVMHDHANYLEYLQSAQYLYRIYYYTDSDI